MSKEVFSYIINTPRASFQLTYDESGCIIAIKDKEDETLDIEISKTQAVNLSLMLKAYSESRP